MIQVTASATRWMSAQAIPQPTALAPSSKNEERVEFLRKSNSNANESVVVQRRSLMASLLCEQCIGTP